MAEGTQVGLITLDLRIVDTLKTQLNDIAGRAEREARKQFSGVGDVISESISKPISQMDEAIKKPLDRMEQQVKDKADDLDHIVANAVKKMNQRTQGVLNGGAVREPVQMGNSATATSQLSSAEVQAAKPPKAAEQFTLASNAAQLLEQKLGNVNAQLGEQQQKLASLLEEYKQIAREKGSGSAEAIKLDSQITAVQGKLISLQASALQTEEKLNRSLDASRGAEKTIPAVEKVKRKIEETANSAQSRVKKSGAGIQKTMNRLSRSVQSALKSAFLMAGLYAFFKAFKSLIGGALGDNKAFSNSLAQVKTNLSAAFMPILQTIMPALNTFMAGLAKVSGIIAAFIAGIMGKSYSQSVQAVKNLNKVKGAADKAEGSLASFDEINVLQKQQSNGGEDTSTADMGDTSWLDNMSQGVSKKLDEMKQKISELGGYFMEKLGGNKAFATLSKSFDKFKSNLSKGFSNIRFIASNVWDQMKISFEENRSKIESGMSGFVAGFANHISILGMIFSGLVFNISKGVKNFFAEKAEDIKDFIDRVISNATESFSNFGISYEEITQKIGDAVSDFFEENGSYISEWSESISNMFWNVAQPVIDFFSGVWLDISTAVREFAENPALGNFLTAIQNLLIQLQPLWKKLNDVIRFCWDMIGNKLNIVLGFLRGLLNGVWQFIKEKFISILNNLTGVIQIVTDLINGDFSGAWEKAKEVVLGVLKSIVNSFSSFINIFIKGINGVISALNKIQVKVPDWVPKFGGRSWGFNIPLMPQIPLLANGGIIDQPTLAMMGEYGGARSNPEIAAPQSLLTETFQSSLSPLLEMLEQLLMYLSRDKASGDIVLQIDGKTFARLTGDYFKAENARKGTKLVLGGAY